MLRTLTSLVGLFFIYSITVAQLPHCQCGIQCLHIVTGQVEATPEPGPTPSDSCCSSQHSTGALEPQPAAELPCGDKDERCPCPVEVSEDSGQDPATTTAVVEFTPLKQVVALSIPASVEHLLRDSLESPTRWTPTRGSPPARPPLHILNSIFIV